VKSSKLPLLLSAMALAISLAAITPHLSKLQIPAWATLQASTEVQAANGVKVGTAVKSGDTWVFTHVSGKKLTIPDKDMVVVGDHLTVSSLRDSKEVAQ
jgi:hypothetical protein